MKKNLLVFLGSILLISSCTIQKRIYSPGYYVDRHSKHHPTILADPNTDDHWKNEQIVVDRTNEELGPKVNDKISSEDEISAENNNDKPLIRSKRDSTYRSSEIRAVIFERAPLEPQRSDLKGEERHKNIFGWLALVAALLGYISLLLLIGIYPFFVLELAAIVLGIIGLVKAGKAKKDDSVLVGSTSHGISAITVVLSVLGILIALIVLGMLFWFIFFFSGG